LTFSFQRTFGISLENHKREKTERSRRITHYRSQWRSDSNVWDRSKIFSSKALVSSACSQWIYWDNVFILSFFEFSLSLSLSHSLS
jgi:hypothetical protein